MPGSLGGVGQRPGPGWRYRRGMMFRKPLGAAWIAGFVLLAGPAPVWGQGAEAKATGETHSLLPNVKVGDEIHYAYRNEIRVGETTAVLAMKITMTIAALEPKGQIVFKNAQSEGTFQRGEQTSKLPDSVNTTTFRLNGELVAALPAPATPEQKRLNRLMQMRVPEGPAGVGAKWTWEEDPNEAGGGVGRKAGGELIAFEERLGMRCAKVRYVVKETSGESPCGGTMEVWFALKDGLPAEVSMQLENAPLGGGALGRIRASNRRTNSKAGIVLE